MASRIALIASALLLSKSSAFNLPSLPSPVSRLASTPETTEEPVVDTATVITPTDDAPEEPVWYNILSEPDPVSVQQQQQPPLQQQYPVLNGWVPKEDFALWGLPGAIAPTGFFDPLGFAREGLPLNDAKRLREAEVQHSRVAMIACVGYFAGEAVQNGPFAITGPANDQLQQMPLAAFALLTAGIAAAELYRAKLGWVEPKMQIGSKTLWTLRDTYYPGDLGFDPLGLKPKDNYEFQRMQTKELSHGRLAMLGWAGMCSQELVNHRTIGDTLDFYSTLFSGGDPYSGYY
mmetsp:Transcript_36116/g.53845  ORF Transcript_36116/g.53845 Transcript_36116/m.53845 type:complete len:290 (-) Transcript_36116:85-954(-)